MNSYQRYMNMVNGRKCDILPRIPIFMHFVADYFNTTYANFAGDGQTLAQANIKLIKNFDFDQLDVLCDPYRETSAFGGQITYLETTVPRCTPPLADTKDLGQLLKPDPEKSPRLKEVLNAIDAYKIFGYQKYSITGWVEGPAAEAAVLRGPQTFLIDLIDDESFICELMDRCIQVAIDYARAQIAHGCDTIGIGDAIASQISLDLYHKFVLPREQQLVAAIRNAGALARLHICGNINHLLPAIAELDIDIIDCDWQVDMKNARKLLGSRVTLTGNLDPVNAVMKSTPQKIREGFLAIYNDVGNPYFVNAGCEIPIGTPHENIRALCQPINYDAN